MKPTKKSIWTALLAVGFSFATVCISAAPLGEATWRKVDAVFEKFDQPDSPGAAVGIYQGGQLVYQHAYGQADLEQGTALTPQSVFQMASTSKQFTAFAIALLAREGKVDLDADYRKYLPEMPDFGSKITVSNLLHHTSGLRDQNNLDDLPGHSSDSLTQWEAVRLVKRQQRLNFEPGTQYSYSNTNYMLLAEIVKKASGQSLREFTTARMFGPLGMTSTFFSDDRDEVVRGRANSYKKGKGDKPWKRILLPLETVGSTGLHTTVGDLAKWAGNFSHPVVGDRALIDQMCASGTLNDGTRINYGFALWRQNFAGHEAFAHGGAKAAFRSFFTWFPAEDFSVVILTNRGDVNFDVWVSAITDICLNDGKGEKQAGNLPKAVSRDPELLAAMAGHYFAPDNKLTTVFVKDGKVFRQPTGIKPRELNYRADGNWDFWSRTTSYVRLRRGTDGKVTAIEEVFDPKDWDKTKGYDLPSVWMRVEPAKPSPAELQELAGDYYSQELDVTYTVAIEQGKVVIHSLWAAKPAVFVPSIADRFDASASGVMDYIVFKRDGQQRVVGVEVSSGRSLNVLFKRTARLQ